MKPKFNLMDLIIVLVVLAVIGAGGFMLSKNLPGQDAGDTGSRKVKVEYQLEVTDKREAYTTLAKPGDSVTIGDKEKLPAVVKDVEVQPYSKVGFDGLNGGAAWNEVPDRYTVVYTLESDAVDSDKSVAVNGTAVRVGSATTIKGNGYAGYGYILTVKVAE